MTTDMMAVRGCLAAAISRPQTPMSTRDEDFERDARITRWLELHRQLHHTTEESEPEPPAYTDENDPKEDET